MDYRREIDGLRAVAVLSAIFFHAGFTTFSGGYVGVDIFFVVSGYLITSIILAERQAGVFTLTSFYERRARRILPALFVVMLACLPFAWLWSLPSDVRNFSDSLVAVTVFSSNLLFWLTSRYFEHDAELRPLLHTWSLAVEEQYYLFFPLLVMLAWRLGRRWVLVLLVIIAALSFIAALVATKIAPVFSYYQLLTRGWELLIGAFVAFYFFDNPNPHFKKAIAEIGGGVGLLLVVYAIVAFDSNTPFPGVYALAPTLGTALIILFATPQTLVGRLLGKPIFVGIGLISYSAYLLNQPLFAFARQRAFGEPSQTVILGLVAVTLVLAYLNWKYVETPFRSKQKFSRRQIFGYSVAGIVFFIGVGVAGHRQVIKTLWQINNPHLITFSEIRNLTTPRDCTQSFEKHGFVFCKVTGSGARVVLWGDSHAGVLSENIPVIDGVELYSLYHYSCPPVVGVKRFDGIGDSVDCNTLKTLRNYAEFVKSLSPDVVILTSRWLLYLHGWQKVGVLQGEHKFLTDSDSDVSIRPMQQRVAMLERHLRETITMLTQHSKVILLTQVPDFGPIGFRCMEQSDFSLPVSDMAAWHKEETEIIDHLKGLPNLTVLDTKQLFCDDKACKSREDGVLLYLDDNHLSPRGTEFLWPLIVNELRKELPSN